MKKHRVGTIGPPDYACIALSFMNVNAEIDGGIHNDPEEPVEDYVVDMDEDVPSSKVATKNRVTSSIYKVNFFLLILEFIYILQFYHDTFIKRRDAHVLTFMGTWFLQGQIGIDLREEFAEEFCTGILQKLLNNVNISVW